MRLFKLYYIITDNKNEAESERQITQMQIDLGLEMGTDMC